MKTTVIVIEMTVIVFLKNVWTDTLNALQLPTDALIN